MRRGSEEKDREESFTKFFESWLTEQSNYLEELLRAANDYNYYTHDDDEDQEDHNDEYQKRILIPLIDRVKKHYEQYYKTKKIWVRQDVLSMYNPSWRSTLEDSFMWIGGWRPTMAFHLLYSKSGIQFQDGFSDLIKGFHLRNLAGLSSHQISLLDNLQSRTVYEEREITEKLAKHQETVADTSMVELSHLATQLMMMRSSSAGDGDGAGDSTTSNNRVESTIASKEEPLVELLIKADELRLKTLQQLLCILNPFQAVHFLIAAAELHLRLHEWGKTRDDNRQQQQQQQEV